MERKFGKGLIRSCPPMVAMRLLLPASMLCFCPTKDSLGQRRSLRSRFVSWSRKPMRLLSVICLSRRLLMPVKVGKNSQLDGIFSSPFGWKYHSTLGWIYSIPTSLDSVWFYDQVLGWCWTNPYPSFGVTPLQNWLYFLKNSSPRYFYDYSDKTWKHL